MINFLKTHLSLSDEAIALVGTAKSVQVSHLLPIILWQYGLLTIEELDQIFEWMDAVAVVGKTLLKADDEVLGA